MANKKLTPLSTLETSIEICRSESKWSRVIELAEELRQSSPKFGLYNTLKLQRIERVIID